MNICVRLLVGFFFLSLGHAYVIAQNNSRSVESQTKSQEQQNTNSERPISPTQNPTIEPVQQPESTEAKQVSQENQPKSDQLPVWVAIVSLAVNSALLIIIAIQVAINYGQWKHMGDQVSKMDSQLTVMKDQADSMKDSLIETRNLVSQNERAVRVAEENAKIARYALAPRLRITSVRVEDFEIGLCPVFIVSMINDGATDARNVEIKIRVDFAKQNDHSLEWSRSQIVTISAGQKQSYPIPSRTTLTRELIEEFNDSAPIEISGYFKQEDAEKKDFCYRYYPWKGKRPAGLDQFFPCDFNPGLIVSVKAMTGGISLVGGIAELKVTRVRRQEQEDENKPGQSEPADSE